MMNKVIESMDYEERKKRTSEGMGVFNNRWAYFDVDDGNDVSDYATSNNTLHHH